MFKLDGNVVVANYKPLAAFINKCNTLWTPRLSPHSNHKFHGEFFTEGKKHMGHPWWLPIRGRDAAKRKSDKQTNERTNTQTDKQTGGYRLFGRSKVLGGRLGHAWMSAEV